MSGTGNTRQLDPNKRNKAVLVDVASASIAACAVAPGIKIVDQGKHCRIVSSCLEFCDFYVYY
jgi:hypothetical protein